VAGETCLALGRYEQAREHLDNSLSLGLESNTVEIICRGQIGMSELAAAEGDWPYAQLWCTEAKARARRAGLEMTVTDARLALARVYLARGELAQAQREARQAQEAGERLRCPYTRLRALALLGSAMLALSQQVRAERLFAEADTIVSDLADTLPESLREAFLAQPLVNRVRTRAVSVPVGGL
jgi:tetratricopeptide (TPR) repeat protein